MTVRFVERLNSYLALSTDTFPSDARDGRGLIETDTGVQRIFDADTGTWFKVEIGVDVQDKTSQLIDLYMTKSTGTVTLSADASVDDSTVALVAGHGVVAGDILYFTEGERSYQTLVLSVATNIITVDTPLDFAYTTAASGSKGTSDMSVDGSATPVVFMVKPVAAKWNVVRVIFHIEDTSTMDDGTFGGQTALANGIVLRKKGILNQNIFNIKTNGDFAERAYDREYVSKPPSGTGNALNVRRTFGGPSKNGVAIRLNSTNNDELQIIINDDLTGLSHFHCIVQGYMVVD